MDDLVCHVNRDLIIRKAVIVYFLFGEELILALPDTEITILTHRSKTPHKPNKIWIGHNSSYEACVGLWVNQVDV